MYFKKIIKEKEKYEIYDLTAVLSKSTVLFPGDPQYSFRALSSVRAGDVHEAIYMNFCNHAGTHIDFPAHVIKNGKTSSDYNLNDLIGSAVIIQVPDEVQFIKKEFVTNQNIINNNDFVFFKTANSKLSKYDSFVENYVYIEPEAAEELVKKGVKIVGIDYLSVDNYASVSLPVHQILLSNNVLIVENLELKEVPTGRCKVYILPLNIKNVDGLPVRIVAEIGNNLN